MVFAGSAVVLVERADRQSVAVLSPILEWGNEKWRLALYISSIYDYTDSCLCNCQQLQLISVQPVGLWLLSHCLSVSAASRRSALKG